MQIALTYYTDNHLKYFNGIADKDSVISVRVLSGGNCDVVNVKFCKGRSPLSVRKGHSVMLINPTLITPKTR